MTTVTEEKTESPGRRKLDSGQLRNQAAQIVWWVCLGLALCLFAAALLFALGGNDKNGLVMFVRDVADKFDLGVFDRKQGVFTFEKKNGHPDMTKNVLVNWGMGGVAWLIIGRVVSGVLHK